MESAKKEIIIAIIIGLIIGGFATIIFTGSLSNILQILKKTDNKQETYKNLPTPKLTESLLKVMQPKEFLEIKNTNGDFSTTSEYIISGLTLPNKTIIISGDIKDYVTNSDKNGKFNIKTILIPGENNFYIYLSESKLENNLSINFFPDE